jgi:hypothetical protein
MSYAGDHGAVTLIVPGGGNAMTAEVMTRDEARVFSAKLEAFADMLSPAEKALFLEILYRAAENGPDDVEGHDLLRSAIAAAVLAAAGALGVSAANMIDAAPATAVHHIAPAIQPAGQWITDDKGGTEYVPYAQQGQR